VLVTGTAATASTAVLAAPPSVPADSDAGLGAAIHAFDWPASAPDDPYFAQQPDLATITVPPAWLRSTGAASVVVAVLDTGIDATHPEFAGRVVPGFDAQTGLADGPADFGATNDDEGHGTHVSGTIAAAADNGLGIAGIAPSTSIMPVKILDAKGGGTFGDMVAGMNWAIGHGARIITMSLGGALDAAGIANVQQAFDAAYAAGVVVVAASGNEGDTRDEYPCNFVHVICVGSTSSDGSTVSAFSTRTAALALVAPGEHILSALPGSGYGYGSGTSMATPHVTGAVALMRAVDPGISVDQVMADLIQTAKPLVAGGRDPGSGYGLLQVAAALELAAGGPGAPVPNPGATAGPSPTPAASPDPGAAPSPDPAASPTPSPTPVATPAVAPSVLSATPRNGARNVLRSTRPRLTFSVPVSGLSLRTVTMTDLSRGRRVGIRVSYSASSHVATIRPTVRLSGNHSYRIVVSGLTSALGAVPLSRVYIVTFRTGYR
jgi:subtilisin family serine protease